MANKIKVGIIGGACYTGDIRQWLNAKRIYNSRKIDRYEEYRDILG